jgi:hypothetical protein
MSEADRGDPIVIREIQFKTPETLVVDGRRALYCSQQLSRNLLTKLGVTFNPVFR